MSEIWLADFNTAWAAPVLDFDVLPTQSSPFAFHCLGGFLMDRIFSQEPLKNVGIVHACTHARAFTPFDFKKNEKHKST